MSKEIQCEKCGRRYHGICECDYPTEDEFILRLCVGLAESLKLWIESNQKERIPGEIDKTAMAITAYMYGVVMAGRK